MSDNTSSRNEKHAFIAQRRASRKLAMVIAYQASMTSNSLDSLYTDLLLDAQLGKDYHACDKAFLMAMVEKSLANSDALNALIVECANDELSQLNPIELSIMHNALIEMKHYPESPPQVVISEAVNLARKFCASTAYKLVNAILDCAKDKLTDTKF